MAKGHFEFIVRLAIRARQSLLEPVLELGQNSHNARILFTLQNIGIARVKQVKDCVTQPLSKLALDILLQAAQHLLQHVHDPVDNFQTRPRCTCFL